ncbi:MULTISPECIES: ferredoxin [Coprobacillaceae]|uniref:ferredoxin n=1 Tax=Coprobacillaceae TaxID=2810280 RepID=UPI000E4EAA44|nr:MULTISPECIES: ferredoxin [Coprobacillaceae]RHM60616.1 ferredoxin [Coprobacillus sp. AF33-1AC]RHS93278.1 ferredoxin [Erysipelatoclostridium sp. AM42-17]
MAKITVNENCIGCGACTGVAPETFEIGDDGLAKAINEDVEAGKEAAETCPVEAIEVEE